MTEYCRCLGMMSTGGPQRFQSRNVIVVGGSRMRSWSRFGRGIFVPDGSVMVCYWYRYFFGR
jgi:hypothetical protein